MVKIAPIANITAGHASAAKINDAFDKVEAAFSNTLSRDGSSPNAMSADLDMNSNDLLNVGLLQAEQLTVDGVPYQIVEQAEYTVNTVTELKAMLGLSTGDKVRTLGYYAAYDGGGAEYLITTTAVHGTPDGYGDHLMASGQVAEIKHKDRQVIDATFGVKKDTECSANWQEAFYSAADLASTAFTDGKTATFVGITDFWTKNRLYAQARNGSTMELLDVYAPQYIKAVTGGNLDDSTFLNPLPMMTVKLSSCKARWGVLDCNKLCSGWLGLSVSAQHSDGLNVYRFNCYGAFIPEGANGAFKMDNYNIKQWRSNDAEWTSDSAYTGYGLVVGNKDMQFGRGEVGWTKVPLLLLDQTPASALDEVEARNIFRGYDSEGTGGCVFNGIHPMAGRPGGPPRLDNITDGGPTLIECWNNTNVTQINFPDMDAGITRIYGKGFEMNRPNYIVGGANDPVNDRAVVLDPVIRIYANGSANPSKISINSEQGVTVGFYDFEGNSWDGVFDAWNRTGRQSTGSWTGAVVEKGVWDPATGAFPAASTAGDFWVVKQAGTVGGEAFVAGDGIIALLSPSSTSTFAANWEHNTAGDVAQRDESAGVQVTQGVRAIHSRNDNNNFMDIFAPGPVGEIRIKMRVASGNPLLLHVDETGDGVLTADRIYVKNWDFAAGGDLQPVNTGAQNLGANANRINNVYATALNLKGTAAGGVTFFAGSGSPEGVQTAGPGSMYHRDNGAAATTVYLKVTGSGNTGWVALGPLATSTYNLTVSTTAPSSPATNDIWIDTN